MSDANQTPPPTGVRYTYGEKNEVLAFFQRPRIMLLLLAGWSILCFLSEVLTDSQLFSNLEGEDMDGLLAGLSFGWEGLALAVVYIYCFRNPDRYPRVFWLAALHMGALTASIIFHWIITGVFSIESVFIPLVGTLVLDALVFVHIFGDEEDEVIVPDDRSG